MFKIRKEGNSNVPQTSSLFIEKGRRWNSNPSGKYLYERPTRGTVCVTMHTNLSRVLRNVEMRLVLKSRCLEPR